MPKVTIIKHGETFYAGKEPISCPECKNLGVSTEIDVMKDFLKATCRSCKCVFHIRRGEGDE